MKETDLDKVKAMAKVFLEIEIGETEMTPAIVQHPFANSGFYPCRSDCGNLRVIDITTPQGFDEWKKIMRERIDGITSIDELFLYVNKPYSMTFLKYIQHYLSPQDYAKTLAECWGREEQPNMNPSITKTELTNMFKRADKEFLMSEREYKKWQDLPEKLTIYRGVTEYNSKNIRALSWTTNYDTAKWFAGRYDEKGKVYQAEIDKKHILACTDKRGESEIIVEPKYLKNIEMVEDLSLNMTIQQ